MNRRGTARSVKASYKKHEYIRSRGGEWFLRYEDFKN